MFKKVLSFTLAITLLMGMGITAQAKSFDKINQGTIRRSGSIIYVEHEIDHGLEFDIISRNAQGSSIDGMIQGVNAGIQAVKPGTDISPNVYSWDSTCGFYDPRIPISTMSGGRKIEGFWWGGIIDDYDTSGGVAAATVSITSDSQSQASVKPGTYADWLYGGWKDNGVRSSRITKVGFSGNQAKWNLR